MESDIFTIMSHGESETVEFLSANIPPLVLAKVISAFANLDGGTILLGVDDYSTIGGIDQDAAKSKIAKALTLLSSDDIVSFNIQRVRVYLNVAVIKVKKSEQIVFCDSGAYIRTGDNIRVMHHEEIRSIVGSSNSSVEALSVVLEKQTLMIESLEVTISNLKNEVAEGNSLKSKLKDHSIGAVIGIVVGIILGAIGF